MINFLLISICKFYKLFVSPLLGSNCRFYPTCCSYAIQALKEHNTFNATKLILFRICKCNPWGGSGIDLVPKRNVKNKN